MKNKLLKILTLILVLSFSFAFITACDNGDKGHTHVYPETYTFDAEFHWFECECGEKKETTQHNFDNGACVCGYKKPAPEHKCSYSEFKFDSISHWYQCVCGEKTNVETHKGGEATCTKKAKCDICATEYGELKSHKYEELKKDSNSHWYECECGDKSNLEEHIPGEEATETTAQKCTVCEFEVVPALGHVHNLHLIKITGNESTCTEKGNKEYYECSCGRWYWEESATTEIINRKEVEIDKLEHNYAELKYNETLHWKECECGEKNDLETHKGGEATCTKKAVCSVCEQKYGGLKAHVFDKEIATEKYFVSEATCKDKAKYNYSCVCGEKGSETFEVGEKVDHEYVLDKCKWCEKEKVTSKGLEFTLINNDTEYEVSGIGDCTDTDVVFPSIYMGKLVTSIGEDAFWDCESITSVEIPNSVTSIGNCAFIGCGSLISVEIPNSVTRIGYDVFSSCSSLTNIKVDSNNTAYKSIDGNLYSKDETTLIQYAIAKKDTSFSIPNRVNVISYSAFRGCYSLETIEIPNSVKEIYNSAFRQCSSLKTIEIPNSITNIGDYAFASCYSLENIEIPNSVTTIGNSVFWRCDSLTNIKVDSNNTAYKSIDGNLYSKDGKILVQYAIGKKDVSFVIPNGVETIGDSVFYSCELLERIEIPNSVTSIGANVFCGCERIKSIEIPNSVKSIGDSAFSNCDSLTSIVIPYSVTSIGDSAFWGCASLTNIQVDSNNTAYKSIDGNLYSKDGTTLIQYANGKKDTSFSIPNSVISIVNSAFYQAKALKIVTVEENSKLTYIGDRAFWVCSSLTSITIPNSVTSIGNYAFEGCSSLTSIEIPNSVTSIGYDAFSSCDSLESVTFEENSKLTYISDSVFAYCSSLTSIEIPTSVTNIGGGAFACCYSLESISFNGTTSEWNEISKGVLWNYYIPATEVSCTDGKVSLR